MALNMIHRPSPNYNDRPNGIQPDMLVLHYTGMATAKAALDRLCDPATEVSAHYMIDVDGTIFCMVPEEKRAWHAGISSWQERQNINHYSIGIEIVNPGHEFGYQSFPEAQMHSVEQLCKQLVVKYSIRKDYVVGHSDIAPARKQDPGEKFDWRRLADKGIGYYPHVEGNDFCEIDTSTTRFTAFLERLTSLGYNITKHAVYDDDCKNKISAFQRHWRPALVSGVLDEGTFSVAADLFTQLSE